MHLITPDHDTVFALPLTDPDALVHAERILHNRALRLGTDYHCSCDGVVVTDVTAFADVQTASLRLELEAQVSPDTGINVDEAQARVAAILAPLLNDARARMRDEIGCEVLATVRVRLVHPGSIFRGDLG